MMGGGQTGQAASESQKSLSDQTVLGGKMISQQNHDAAFLRLLKTFRIVITLTLAMTFETVDIRQISLLPHKLTL